MPPDENPQPQDNREGDIDQGAEKQKEEQEKKNALFQARLAISAYENIEMPEQIKRSKANDILVTSNDWFLARQLEEKYSLLKKLDSAKDFSPDEIQYTLKRFVAQQEEFHKLIRAKETDDDRRAIPDIIASARAVYKDVKNQTETMPAKVAKVENHLIQRSQECTRLEAEVLADKLKELCKQLNKTVRDMREDEEEQNRATKDLDEYLDESKESEEGHPSRIVLKVRPDEIARIGLPGGGVLEIYDQKETLFLQVIEVNNKGRSANVKIPEKFKDQAHGADSGSVSYIRRAAGVALNVERKLPYFAEVSVEGVRQIIDLLDLTIENLLPIQNEDAGPDGFWREFKEIYKNKLTKILGSEASEMLAGSSGNSHHESWLHLPTDDDLRRASPADIGDHIKRIEKWKDNMRKGIEKRDPKEIVYMNIDGILSD